MNRNKIEFKNDPRKRKKTNPLEIKPRMVSGLLHIEELNRARQFYNPLRGLTIGRLIGLLEQANRGQYAYWQALCEILEKRDATLLSLIERRSSAIDKLDWSVKPLSKIPQGFTEQDSARQAQFLSAAYEQIENLKEAIDFLAMASFRGYSHLEIARHTDGQAAAFVPVHQWHWVRSMKDYTWIYDPLAKNNFSTGTRIEEGEFIVREVARPLNELASICYIRKAMGKKDWDAFLESFGIPSIFGILSPNTPEARVTEWLDAMEKVVGNSRGALPPGSDIKTIAEGSRGQAPFLEHIKYQNEELVLAGTGGKLTMLAESGSGTLAGSAHQDAFDDIANAEAGKISEIFQKQFDRIELAREFPHQPVLCYFEIASQDEEDLDALARRLVYLNNAGFEADEAEMTEKFGLTLHKIQVPAPTSPKEKAEEDRPGPLRNRKTLFDDPLNSAFTEDTDELLNRLAAIQQLEDEEYALFQLQLLYLEFPQISERILKNDNLQAQLEKVYATAFLQGAIRSQSETSRKSPTKAFNREPVS